MMILEHQSYLASRASFHQMACQAETGIAFDKAGAESLVLRIQAEMKLIEEEIEPKLPPRKLKKSEESEYTVPAKPFKKDGTLSAVMERWLLKHPTAELLAGTYPPTIRWIDGSFHTIEGGTLLPASMPMTLGNSDDLKDWFLEQKWLPSLWNVKKDARGKPERDAKGNLIQTSPKMQENGRLCPNLEAMSGDLVRPIVRWLSLRNRMSVVNGWLGDNRLAYDGRLSAGASGLASSHRFRHACVVNVPKAEDGVILGKEMRSLFIARPGNVLVGYDASGLEARVEAHYCYGYEGGEEYAHDLLEGDIHLKTAASVFAKQLEGIVGTDEFHKDNPLVKIWRSKSKTIKYSLSYGSGVKKLAGTLGIPVGEATQAYDAFWEAAKPLALLKQALELFWETTGEKKWIVGIDGTRLFSRAKHSLTNLLFQSAGAKIMDYSAIYMNKWLGGLVVDADGVPCYHYRGVNLYRILYQHDEYGWDCPPEVADEVGRMGVRSIEMAGKFLKFKVPLAGEYKTGPSWASTH